MGSGETDVNPWLHLLVKRERDQWTQLPGGRVGSPHCSDKYSGETLRSLRRGRGSSREQMVERGELPRHSGSHVHTHRYISWLGMGGDSETCSPTPQAQLKPRLKADPLPNPACSQAWEPGKLGPAQAVPIPGEWGHNPAPGEATHKRPEQDN